MLSGSHTKPLSRGDQARTASLPSPLRLVPSPPSFSHFIFALLKLSNSCCGARNNNSSPSHPPARQTIPSTWVAQRRDGTPTRSATSASPSSWLPRRDACRTTGPRRTRSCKAWAIPSPRMPYRQLPSRPPACAIADGPLAASTSPRRSSKTARTVTGTSSAPAPPRRTRPPEHRSSARRARPRSSPRRSGMTTPTRMRAATTTTSAESLRRLRPRKSSSRSRSRPP